MLPTRAITALLASTLLLACGVEPNEKSGGDEKRGTAKKIPLAQPVHDRLNRAEGDATDWKVFTVPVYETYLTISAWWDNPDVLATITVRDQFGGKMYELDHRLGDRKESWGPIRVREGNYFLEVDSSGGTSVYTLEIELEEGGPQRAPGVIPRPE
jgi:hypothetical protein